MDKKISIVIADDHQVTRTGMSALLERHSDYFQVVGEAERGFTAVNLCKEKKPNILILDLHMPGDLDGFEVIRAIRNLKLNLKIMVLTADNFAESMLVKEMRVDKCLNKEVSNETILEALRELAETNKLLGSTSHPEESLTLEKTEIVNQFWTRPLSPRELEVLKAAARGFDKEQIGQELVLTSGTVGVHLTSIYRKLGVKNRAEAISFAYRNRLLT